MKIIKIDNNHEIGQSYDLQKNHLQITFVCDIKHHGYSCSQPFDFCPSCGKQLPVSAVAKLKIIFKKIEKLKIKFKVK